MSIPRINFSVEHSSATGLTTVSIAPCEHGRYVTYESHREEIDRLQAEIERLKSMQNHQYSDDAIAAINDAVATCVKAELERFFKQAAEKTFKVELDPARDLAKEWSDALKKVDSEPSRGVFAVNEDGFHIFIEGCEIKMDKLSTDAQPPKRYYAKCIFVKGATSFTFGKEYACEPSEHLNYIDILSDDYVGDLSCDDVWNATLVRDGVYEVFCGSSAMSAMFELIQK